MTATLAAEIRAARQWRSRSAHRRKASPRYNDWLPLARTLHTDPADPWPVKEVARYLKNDHPEARKTFAATSLPALHRALCRRLSAPSGQ